MAHSKAALAVANQWESIEYCRDERLSAHQQILRDLQGATVLLNYYTYESYSGSAMVLYEKDGKLFEVNGGHCSCHGLEGQWSPEETTLEALYMRKPYEADLAVQLTKACMQAKSRRTRRENKAKAAARVA